MTSIGMTSHCMTSPYGVHFCFKSVNRTVPYTCKVSIRYVSWFTRYSTTLIIFRMTLVYNLLNIIDVYTKSSGQIKKSSVWTMSTCGLYLLVFSCI